jgi:hypothetical protein
MKPNRNLKYLAWIRTLPCLVCERTTGIEAAHTGPHGMAQKSPDTSAIPLCRRHHRTGRDSYHKLGARAFERHHGLDLRAVEAHLNTKACIRIEFGSFVAHYLGDQYVLGPASIGVRSAVRQALNLKRQDRSWLSLEAITEPDVGSFLRIRERLQTRL